MTGTKRITVVVVILVALAALGTAASASAGPEAISQSSSRLNFILTPSQTVPMVNGWTGQLLAPSPRVTPNMVGFASFALVDAERGIARFSIFVPKLPSIEYDGVLAGLYWGQPGEDGGYVTGLALTQKNSRILIRGSLEWDVLVRDLFRHPGNYYVQLVDMQHPGPFGVPLLRGQVDNAFSFGF